MSSWSGKNKLIKKLFMLKILMKQNINFELANKKAQS